MYYDDYPKKQLFSLKTAKEPFSSTRNLFKKSSIAITLYLRTKAGKSCYLFPKNLHAKPPNRKYRKQ